MKRVERSPEVLKYTIDSQHAPILEVELGESFALATEDACSGSYRTLGDAARLLDAWYLNYSPPKANPVTGPVYCEAIKGKQVPFVRLDKDMSIISLACARPLEEAVWRASIQLMRWLTEDYGCSQRQAYLLVGINPDFHINVYQTALMAKLQYTVGAEILKRSLPNA